MLENIRFKGGLRIKEREEINPEKSKMKRIECTK